MSNSTYAGQLSALENSINLDVLSKRKQNLDKPGQMSIEDFMGPPKHLNPRHHLGMLGEIIVLKHFITAGYMARQVIGFPYDIIVDQPEMVKRVQVKVCNGKHCHQVSMVRSDGRGKHSRYKVTEFDYLAAVYLESEDIVLIPSSLLEAEEPYKGYLKRQPGIKQFRDGGYKLT